MANIDKEYLILFTFTLFIASYTINGLEADNQPTSGLNVNAQSQSPYFHQNLKRNFQAPVLDYEASDSISKIPQKESNNINNPSLLRHQRSQKQNENLNTDVRNQIGSEFQQVNSVTSQNNMIKQDQLKQTDSQNQLRFQRQFSHETTITPSLSKEVYDNLHDLKYVRENDVNNNELLADAVLKRDLISTKQKKRYKIIYKNGQVEHVDSLENVKRKHPNVKVYKKNELNKLIPEQIFTNKQSVSTENKTTNKIVPKDIQVKSNGTTTNNNKISEAYKNTKPNKSYKVIHPNGKIEYIETLDNISQQYQNYIIFDEEYHMKEIIKELDKQILPSLTAITKNTKQTPANIQPVENISHDYLNVNPSSKDIQAQFDVLPHKYYESNKAFITQSPAKIEPVAKQHEQNQTFNINSALNYDQAQLNFPQANKNDLPENPNSKVNKRFKVIHPNGKIEYIETLDNVGQQYQSYVLLNLKDLVKEDKPILPTFQSHVHNVSVSSPQTSQLMSEKRFQSENNSIYEINETGTEESMSAPKTKIESIETSSSVSPIINVDIKKAVSAQKFQGTVPQEDNNIFKYDIVGLPNIENRNRVLESEIKLRENGMYQIYQYTALRNTNLYDVENLTAVISPPSTSDVLQKLILEDENSLTKLNVVSELPVPVNVTDSNSGTPKSNLINANDKNQELVTKVTETSTSISLDTQSPGNISKNAKVLTQDEMVDWASTFMYIPYSDISVQMSPLPPQFLDGFDVNGTVTINIDV